MKKPTKTLGKVLYVCQSYKIENNLVVPDTLKAKVVDTKGFIRSFRLYEQVNVGDEVEIWSTTIGEEPDTSILSTVFRNFTQQEIIKDFVTKNKTKKR